MTLWRIHIRPDGEDSYQFCLDNHVVGMGWSINNPDPNGDEIYANSGFVEADLIIRNFDAYAERAMVVHGAENLENVRRLANEMQINDLVWIRSPQGIYHLCRVSGNWEYNGDAPHRNADIVNIRPVEIIEVGLEDNVPGKIVNCFIPQMTAQPIRAETASVYSQYLWDRSHNNPLQQNFSGADIFDLMSPFECEDLVSVYLQSKGYFIYFPPTKRTAIAYEFVVRCNQNPHTLFGVQVKIGGATIDIGGLPGNSIVFQPNGLYSGQNPNCTIIVRNEMVSFLTQNMNILPGRIQNFIGLIGIQNLR